MLRKISFSLIVTACSLSAWAQSKDSTAKAPDTAKPAAPVLAITGSADFYYRYDFNKQKSAGATALTSFTHSHDKIALGMATVKLEHKTAKLDMVADLGFGPRAREFDYTDEGKGIDQALKQLYISYSPAAWIKFTGGVWATHIGYEVLDAYANRNYSMSYMFTNGPFSHTGLRADLTFGKAGFMIGVANPTDFRLVPDNLQNNKNMIAQFSYAPSDNFHLFLNYVGGRDVTDTKVHQYDLVLTAKASSMFSLGLNGTVNKSSSPSDNYATGHTWWGSAVYLNLDPAPWFGLTLRSEYFSDKDGIKLFPVDGKTGAKVFANTLSANFKVDGFIFIPEFRYDHGSEVLFTKNDGTQTKGCASLLLAAIYSF